MKWHRLTGFSQQETSAMEVPGGVVIRETSEQSDSYLAICTALVFVPNVVIVEATYHGGDASLEPA